jgi:hypothetical protein
VLNNTDSNAIPDAEAKAAAGDMLTAQKLRDLRAARDELDRRIHDLRLTRQVAMQALPSIRLIQENDKALSSKIHSVLANTVPLWRQQLAQALAIHRMREAGQAVKQARFGQGLSPQGWALLGVAPVLLLGAGLPHSHQLRYYLPLLLLPALTALGWGWPRGPRRWIEALLLALLAVSLLLTFTQPLHSTLKGLRQGKGLSYALHYPSRDLPSAATCLQRGLRRPDQPGSLGLPTGQAFACRLQLPASIPVVEIELPPELPTAQRQSAR